MLSPSTSELLIKSLQKSNLSPSKVIPVHFTPSISISVKFESKDVQCGNLFRVSEVKNEPTVEFTSIPTKTYTLLLVDPDAPTPDDPKFAWWRHWVVSNIRAAPTADASTEEAEFPLAASHNVLTQYLAPGVKDESGPHRYTFLLYEEPRGLVLNKTHDLPGEAFVDRRSFQVDDWVQRHGLRLVGVNWFTGVGDGFRE